MDGNQNSLNQYGIHKLAGVLQQRTKVIATVPTVVDVGEILEDFSLRTNKFPLPIPVTDYMVCRSVAWGQVGEVLYQTQEVGLGQSGGHEHLLEEVEGHGHPPLEEHLGHVHDYLVGEKMRSLQAGDRVLVVWLDSCDPCVVDLIVPASEVVQ